MTMVGGTQGVAPENVIPVKQPAVGQVRRAAAVTRKSRSSGSSSAVGDDVEANPEAITNSMMQEDRQ